MNAEAFRHHVVLIGIDAYPKGKALHGCVNDVDALESVFIDCLGVPPEAITKLVAPHAGSKRPGRVSEEKPTAEKIRAALEALTTNKVCPGDRVFIHYSGHGTQTFSSFSRAAREALVPVDGFSGGELLFDYELNDILRRIAERTEHLTVVLDCCCSAGATRSGLASRSSAIRFCRVDDEPLAAHPAHTRSAGQHSGLLSNLDPSDPGFLVAASAQSGEWANENNDAHGVRHGAFTAALLDILATISPDKLDSLRWVDIWHRLRSRVTASFTGQHPCLIGRHERRVFGGPFRLQDAGFPITEINGAYHLHAGTLIGLGVGATVAVYGEEPRFFPKIDSPEDKAVRRGLLRITSATASSAIASPLGIPPQLESTSSRGRLVQSGAADKLVVALEPYDSQLAKYLESEGGFRVVSFANPGDQEIEALVHWSSNGFWWLGDDVFGLDAPLVQGQTLDRLTLVDALRHYARYHLPLRLARRDRQGLDWLRLRVLDATSARMLDPEEWHDPALPEADPDPDRRFRYEVLHGQPICFSLENRSPYPLCTNVINCSASGRVEILGPTQLQIAPNRKQTFWLRGELGKPFPCSVSAGREFNIERVVAVGTSSPEVDLSYLRVKESFAESLGARSRTTRTEKEGPSEFWTATSITVKIVRRRDESRT